MSETLPAPLVPPEVDLRGLEYMPLDCAGVSGSVGKISFRTARVAPEKADFRPALPLRSSPGLFGADMEKMTYGEQLRHPNWQRVRLERLNAAGWKCEVCEGAETTLHVHHKRYVKGRMAWEYPAEELAVLCDPCHADAHLTRAGFLHLLCFAETYPRAGITEADLYAVCWSFLAGAAGGLGADEFWALERSESKRCGQAGHAAAAIYNAGLDDDAVADLGLLFDGPWKPRLLSLIAEARADLDAQVRRDLDAEKGAG